MKRVSIGLMLLVILGCKGPEAVVANPPEPKPEPAATQGKPESLTELDQKSQDPRHKVERIHQVYELETKTMKVGIHTLTVWIMDDESKRAEGMMWLTDKDVKDTEGMLFIFKDAAARSFWMQNCPLGLDICYIDSKSKVLNVGVGKPYDESGVPCKGEAQYVLELKPGRAAKFGIRTGTVLKLPAGIKAKE